MRYFLNRLKMRVIWSWAGCVATWKNEHSFRSWVWANLISAGLAFVLPLDAAERALISERRPVNLTHSDAAIFAPDQAAFPEDSGAI